MEPGLPVKVENAGAPLRLDGGSERSLLLFIREALRNAVRHGAPQNISIALRFEGTDLRVEIEDDGRGFDASVLDSSPEEHYGLVGMRERAERLGGRFDVATSPG